MKQAYDELNVVALAGGVGGARLAHGLAQILPPERLSIVVNTGDDFEHWGLTICPDLDTVMYTLGGVANPQTGWGRAGETFNCLDSIEALGGPAWFHLGDRDLATHLLRTQWLREGYALTEVTQQLTDALGIGPVVLPMADEPYRTRVLSDEGDLGFQTYFVKRRCEPAVYGFRWNNPEDAQPTSAVMTALDQADLVVICPSNPFVSIDPILSLPGLRERIAAHPTVAMSPILGGDVVKGPAAKMFRELGAEPSALAVAEHYRNLLAGFVLDKVDADLVPAVEALGMAAQAMPTLMVDPAQRAPVARETLAFAATLL